MNAENHRKSLQDKEYELLTADGKFVQLGTRQQAKQLGLYRPTVHILIFNKEGELLISQRPVHARVYPNLWSSSAGGHVEIGEKPDKAAQRELLEELNIKTPLKYLGKSVLSLPERNGIQYLYCGMLPSKQRPRAKPSEISKCIFLSLPEIQGRIRRQKDSFTNEFLAAMKLYLSHRNSSVKR